MTGNEADLEGERLNSLLQNHGIGLPKQALVGTAASAAVPTKACFGNPIPWFWSRLFSLSPSRSASLPVISGNFGTPNRLRLVYKPSAASARSVGLIACKKGSPA